MTSSQKFMKKISKNPPFGGVGSEMNKIRQHRRGLKEVPFLYEKKKISPFFFGHLFFSDTFFFGIYFGEKQVFVLKYKKTCPKKTNSKKKKGEKAHKLSVFENGYF
jgi:hypothetical protein